MVKLYLIILHYNIMKKWIYLLIGLVVILLIFAGFNYKNILKNERKNMVKNVNRLELSNEKFKELFGSYPNPETELDPELMNILRKSIFGDVFHSGILDNKTREMITVTSLATMQTLPQLKSHSRAALDNGVSPIELREIIYQLAPFIGFPKTLNAIGVVNEVFKERNIQLPLEKQGTTDDSNRHQKGFEIQNPLYGDEIAKKFKDLPAGFNEFVPEFLTDFGFGDFYTRNGLDLKTRELLVLVVLTTLGAQDQIKSHTIGNLKAGNSKEVIVAAIVQTIPYIGFPNALNTLKIVQDIVK